MENTSIQANILLSLRWHKSNYACNIWFNPTLIRWIGEPCNFRSAIQIVLDCLHVCREWFRNVPYFKIYFSVSRKHCRKCICFRFKSMPGFFFLLQHSALICTTSTIFLAVHFVGIILNKTRLCLSSVLLRRKENELFPLNHQI